MSDFVAYHTSDCLQMIAELGGGPSIGTNKPAERLIGHRVWVIVGEGTPRSYRLSHWFTADSVEPDPLGRFKTRVSGTGVVPPREQQPVLDDEPWFDAFRRSQRNFSFGVNRMSEEIVQEFERLASQA